MKVSMEGMHAAADEASALLRALANRHRLLILCRLVEGESSVGALADALRLRDSTVSQHLALLRKDGLVSTRRDGQTIWYTVSSAPARAVLDVLYRSYCGAPTARKPAAAQRAARPR